MTRSESIGQLAAALAKAQKAIKGAVKDAKNPHFNSRYADLATIHDACREPLAENEIAVVQSPHADGNLVRLTTLLIHSSGEWVESDPLQVQARDAAPQAVGSCLTYLRRYQLAAMVGVAPEDDDAEAAEGRGVEDARVKVPAKQVMVNRPVVTPQRATPRPIRTAEEPPPLSDKDIPF